MHRRNASLIALTTPNLLHYFCGHAFIPDAEYQLFPRVITAVELRYIFYCCFLTWNHCGVLIMNPSQASVIFQVSYKL